MRNMSLKTKNVQVYEEMLKIKTKRYQGITNTQSC